MTDKQKSEVSFNLYKEVQACANLGEALEVLVDTVAATVAANIESHSDRALIIGACIKRLKRYEKQMRNGL